MTTSHSKHPHYYKDVKHLETVDVYRVLELFSVVNPCIQHAVKKLLVAGGRGAGKDQSRDIQEAIDSLVRWQQMRDEDAPRPAVVNEFSVEREVPIFMGNNLFVQCGVPHPHVYVGEQPDEIVVELDGVPTIVVPIEGATCDGCVFYAGNRECTVDHYRTEQPIQSCIGDNRADGQNIVWMVAEARVQ